MFDLLALLLSAIFVNNVVVTQFLGLCPFLGASQRLVSALGLAGATLFVMTLASGVGYLIDTYVLVPLALTHLRIIAFIIVIALLVQFMAVLIRATQPLIHEMLGVYIPLITTNCMVLGTVLISARTHGSLAEAILTGFGSGIGFGLILLAFASQRERISHEMVPKAFQGVSVHVISAGIMALGFMGFIGISSAT